MATKKIKKATLKYGGVEINLTQSPTQAAIKRVPGRKSAEPAGRSLEAPPRELEDYELVEAKRDIDKRLDELRAQVDVSVGTHIWHMAGEEDVPFIPTGKLYIEFKAEVPEPVQHDVLDDYFFSILEIVGPGAFRVSVTPRSPNPIRCAQQLQEDERVAVAEPEFLTKPVVNNFVAPAGRFINTQWHHENNGGQIPIIDLPSAVFGAGHFRRGADAKVRAAWAFLGNTGSPSVTIAVIDTGFALEHPQLRGDGAKVRRPFNAATRAADVSPWTQMADGSWGVQSHGTSCAAVACGALDGQGVLGAAPNARLMPIKLDILSDEAIKNAFEHALLNGADVISCSLGFPKAVPLSTYVTNYLRRLAAEGRGGKGIPMFFAAGNANPTSNYQPRPVSDFAAHPDGICITASNSLDERSNYSFFGPAAHNCAPTNGNNGVGITTATIDSDKNGRLVLGYTSGFGGTSSAAPLAAGICALILSANPGLTLAQVKSILRQSADKIGPANAYDANGHSQYYGYGRINALRAVQLARQLAQGATTPSQPTQPTTPPTQPATPTQPTGQTGSGGAASVKRGRVISKFLNVRTGPATTYTKVRELNQGDVVNLLENLNGWWRIGLGQYVSDDYIQVLSDTRRGRVTSSFLNVRSGPAVSNAKVNELHAGDIVTIQETSADGWHRIGAGQWVLGKYVQLV